MLLLIIFVEVTGGQRRNSCGLKLKQNTKPSYFLLCRISRHDQMPLVCDAYKTWFVSRYIPSFDEQQAAQDRVTQREWDEHEGRTVSSSAIYIPQPIQCPLSVFRKELSIYLDYARAGLVETSG